MKRMPPRQWPSGQTRPRKRADTIPARELTTLRVRRALGREMVLSIEEMEEMVRRMGGGTSFISTLTPEILRELEELERAGLTNLGPRGKRFRPGQDAA